MRELPRCAACIMGGLGKDQVPNLGRESLVSQRVLADHGRNQARIDHLLDILVRPLVHLDVIWQEHTRRLAESRSISLRGVLPVQRVEHSLSRTRESIESLRIGVRLAR